MISRFYEQFSQSIRNLGHFWKFEKMSDSWNTNISNITFKQVIWRFQKYNFFAKYLNFAKIKAIMYFSKFLNAFVKTRNLNFSRNKLYIWNLQISSKSLKFFRTSKKWPKTDYFAKVAYKITKSKYFSDV